MRTFLILVYFTLSGCSNVGTKFNVSELRLSSNTNAIVFFYRPSRFLGSAVPFPIIANNIEAGKSDNYAYKKIGSLENGAFFKIIMIPGTYKLHSDTLAIDKISTTTFEAGKIYFVRCFMDAGLGDTSINFIVVDNNEALLEIKNTALQL